LAGTTIPDERAGLGMTGLSCYLHSIFYAYQSEVVLVSTILDYCCPYRRLIVIVLFARAGPSKKAAQEDEEKNRFFHSCPFSVFDIVLGRIVASRGGGVAR